MHDFEPLNALSGISIPCCPENEGLSCDLEWLNFIDVFDLKLQENSFRKTTQEKRCNNPTGWIAMLSATFRSFGLQTPHRSQIDIAPSICVCTFAP